MAEVAGLVIGGIGLAATFDTAVNAFDRVETGKAYGRDYQEASLSIATLQLRLVRWRNTVKIVDDASLERSGLPVASAEAAEVLGGLLGSIARNFSDAEQVARLHKPKAGSIEPRTPATGSAMIDELEKKVRDLTLQRQKGSSFKQKVRWVFKDQKRFDNIVRTLRDQVTDVEELFPADEYQAQQNALVKYAQDDAKQLTEAPTVIQPSEVEEPEDAALSLLKAAELVDPQLKEALDNIAKSKTGHIHGKLTMTDNAKALEGLLVTSDYNGPTNITDGHTHTYGDTTMSGNARITRGTQLGGKGVFDD